MIPTPLYLHAKEPMLVKLRAPALCIQTESSSERLFPIRRITRIQVSGPVEWRTDALLACAEKGICIHFLDAQGNIQGRFVGTARKRHQLADHLKHMMSFPQWEEKYRQWCWAMTLQTQRYVARKIGFNYGEARDLSGLAKWATKSLVRQSSVTGLDQSLQWLRQDLYDLITQNLLGKGIWQESMLMLSEPVDLAGDLASILQWHLLFIRDKQLRQRRISSITHRHTARWSVKHQDFLQYQVSRLSARLELWIMEEF